MILLIPLALALTQTPSVQVQTPLPKAPPPVRLPVLTSEVLAGPLSMDQAVTLAQLRSPRLIASRATVAAARARVGQVRSSLGPQADLGASYLKAGRFGPDGSVTRDEPLGLDLSIRQLLFDFQRTESEVSELRALARAAELDLQADTQVLSRDVRLAYVDLANAEELISIREGDVQNRQFQLNLAQSRLEDGLGAPGDVLRARTSLANAMAGLVAAQSIRHLQASRLATLMGLNATSPIELARKKTEEEEEESIEDEKLEELVREATTRRPDLLSQRQRVEASQYGLSAARKGLSPAISATVSVAGSGKSNPVRRGSTLYGVQIGWPIFDSGRTRSAVAEAAAIREQNAAEETRITLDVSQQVIEAWLDFQSANDSVELQRTAVINAKEAARIAQGRYSDGLGTFIEVTDTQAAYLQAQVALVTAEADRRRAEAKLRWSIGKA